MPEKYKLSEMGKNIRLMKRLYCFLLFLYALTVSAQEIKVKSMEQLTSDLTARTYPRNDANDVPCALIKVTIPMVKNMVFKGWVMGDVSYHPGEYWVYVPEGAKKILFQHENFVPGEIVFTMPVERLCVYRVILDVPEVTKYATECSAFVTEGGRLFGLREYKNARQAYLSAMKANDAPVDMLESIQYDLNMCDSCINYEKYALGAINKMKQLRASDNASQEDVVRYASAAIEFLHVLNTYNPCDFYSDRIEKLDEIIQDLPLDIRFTVVRWEKGLTGFSEKEGMANVEVWAYYGTEHLMPNDYDTDRAFRQKLDSSDLFKRVSSSDGKGIADVHLDRKALPTAFVFRPIGYDKSAKITYVEMRNVLNDSQGTYNMRQFRLRMYIEKK